MAILSSLLFTGAAQAQTVQIFGGYSYMRPPVTVENGTPCSTPPCTATTHLNMNGWEMSGTYNPFHVFGFTADFSDNAHSMEGAPLKLRAYLFGPPIHGVRRGGRRRARPQGGVVRVTALDADRLHEDAFRVWLANPAARLQPVS